MYKQAIAVTLLALAAVSYAQISDWIECGTTGITIDSITIGQCGQVPCSFVRGNTYGIQVLGTALSSSSDLPFNVTASFLGLEAVVMSGNICEQMSCPTQAGQNIQFGYEYTVSDILPPLPRMVTTRVWNDIGALTMCFYFGIVIV